MRIPFDAFCLAGVVAELRSFVGARVERVFQTDATTVRIVLGRRPEGVLLVSWDPELARAHLCDRRPPAPTEVPPFCGELRSRLKGAALASVSQRDFDRILDLRFVRQGEELWLIAEIMGKHSNLMLADGEGRLLAAAKWVGPRQSRRTILPGQIYTPPPFDPKPPILQARPTDDLSAFAGASPFLRRLVEADPDMLGRIQQVWAEGRFSPVYVPGRGAYPVSVAVLGWPEVPRQSVSRALEQHFEDLARERECDRLRSSLRIQVERVLLAREVALAEISEAEAAADRAREWQREGELLLAYQHQIAPGSREAEVLDHEGRPIVIDLDPDRSPVENARLRFDRARHALAGLETLRAQRARLEADRVDAAAFLAELETADRERLLELQALATTRRWLNRPVAPTRAKRERPFEGLPIRELVSPNGWRILLGESAEANDYLTTRVARPNDWWLHVRGAPSAHAIIATGNRPERVQKADLEYVARLVADRSPLKHSGYVSVDYTLKKYVRKPKGSAPGVALYSHEKTLAIVRDRPRSRGSERLS